MAITNLTKLKKKLIPEPDGQDVLRLRTGVVSVLNANGTADVVVAGATIPGVKRLVESSITVGAVVQILSYRGSLLIVGRVATGPQSGGLGLWARGQSTASATGIGSTLVSVLATNTVTFVKGRVYECKSHGGVRSPTSGTLADFRAYRTGPATQLGEFFRIPVTVGGTTPFNATLGGIYFTTAANVSGGVSLYMASSSSVSPAGNVEHVAGSANGGTPRNIEVYDVGDSSQYPGIITW